MSKLKSLKLQRSYLRKLPSFKNTNVNNTETENNISSAKTSQWFNPELELLDVSHNHYLYILAPDGSDTLFPPSVKKLDFTGDSVPVLDDLIFSNLRSLQSLKLDMTRLNVVSQNSFTRNDQLEEVSITGNTLREIPQLPATVKVLNLMDNTIEKVTSLTGWASNEQTNYSYTTTVTKENIKNLLNLEVINLSHGKISFIESGVFKDMYKLSSLNISNNQLKEISDHTLEIRLVKELFFYLLKQSIVILDYKNLLTFLL